jgi:kynurenine 3-monooxygenase
VNRTRTAIIGGGLCGNLLAIGLARRGFAVEVFERRTRPVAGITSEGRSINLALAERGLEALRRFTVLGAIEPMLLPMRGRMIHESSTQPVLVPYGSAGECIYSVSRAALNYELYQLAVSRGVRFHFESECTGYDQASGRPVVANAAQPTLSEFDVVFAADGAGSIMRRSFTTQGLISTSETLLEHGYKELSVAPLDTEESDAGPKFALQPDALHIWPRSEFMLIALPNTDCSFTATLFLSRKESPGFDDLNAENIEAFFLSQFADVSPLIENLPDQFARNAIGELGTVRCTSWHHGNCLLIGDAAHAIVPFHGQGMNAAFEDVLAFDELLDEHFSGDASDSVDWPALFREFETRRMPNTDAIADMALENYLEMRERVRDPEFLLQRSLALELERRFPDQFISRYAMVMFRPDIPYAQAQQVGRLQSRMLRDLTRGATRLEDINFARAAERIAELNRQL